MLHCPQEVSWLTYRRHAGEILGRYWGDTGEILGRYWQARSRLGDAVKKIEGHGAVDAGALAAEYHLGVPVRRHTLLLDRVTGVGCSSLLVAVNLLFLLTAAELIGEN